MKKNIITLSLPIISSSLLLLALITLPSHADSIDDFQTSWLGKAMALQRSLNLISPLLTTTFKAPIIVLTRKRIATLTVT